MKHACLVLFSLFCFCSAPGCGKEDPKYANIGALYTPANYTAENTKSYASKAHAGRQNIDVKLKQMSKDELFQFALVCGNQGSYSEALAAYNEILETDACYPRIYYHLGLLYRDMGLQDEAICAFQTDLVQNPGSPETHYNLGYAYQSKGLHSNATNEYKQSLHFIPANKIMQRANIHYNLGDIYFSSGAINEAIDEYKKALELKPEDKAILKKLGIANHAKGLDKKVK